MEHKTTTDDVFDVSKTPSNGVTDGSDVAAPDRERPVSSEGSGGTQEGVKRIEAISMVWSKWGLIAAYFGIFLMAFTTSLEGQVTYSVVAFATSSFSSHSLIATVYVIQGVVNAVIKPPMAKIADVFGRLEAFIICIFLYVLGYIQMAASGNVQTFAAAQIFYSAGSTGLQILQQVFIADTSNLENRALLSSIPDVPFLATVWIGPIIGAAFIATSSWRWAYGIWAIILPVVFLPLALTLFLNGRRAKRLAPPPEKHMSEGGPFTAVKKVVANIWYSLDIGGILLLSASFSLILIPLTLTKTTPGGWQSPTIIALIVVGGVLLIAFPFWESSKKLAPHPLIPLELLKSRTFCAGCAIGFFYFLVFYLSVQPYFYSYLLVVQHQSVPAAGHITQTFSFTSTVTSIVVSLLIKYTRHYKYFVTSGSLIYLLGVGLMIRYRTEDTTTGSLVGTQIAVGIGGGMLNVPAQLGVQASASHQQVAAATAVFLTIVEIGGAVGAAISGAVWTQNIPSKLSEYLPADVASQAHTIFGDVTVASNYTLYPAGSPARMAINRSYQETMHTLLIIAISLCAPLVLISLLMRNYKLDAVKQGVKGKVIGGNVGENEKELVEESQSTGPRMWFRKKNTSSSN
ncbi:siderophore iron transporter-like protein [Xylaria flabelliformis]|nr:siderophore iron transporter-like protein [Xylaria flabelliformis]